MSAVFSGLAFLNFFPPLLATFRQKMSSTCILTLSFTVSQFQYSLQWFSLRTGSSRKWTPLGCEKGIHNIGAGRLWECKNTEFVFVKVAASRAVRLGLRVSVRRASTIVIIGNPCSF